MRQSAAFSSPRAAASVKRIVRVSPGVVRALCAVLLGSVLLIAPARACDVCAIYTATEQGEARTGLRLGIAEQYTHFGTERFNGDVVDLPATEYADSAITQFLVGYGVTPRINLQLSIPYIVRTFRRIERHVTETGSERGLGDLSLVGQAHVFSHITERGMFRASLLAGVKFPTGDTDRLGEEAMPPGEGVRSGRAARARSTILPLAGGLHGHDLTLGSGSFDGIVGGQLFWSHDRFFLTGGMQYAIRGDGDHDYRFANDLTWSGGPGVYVLLAHTYTLGLQAVIAGETKGKDTQQGVRAGDTAITALYVGPGVSFTWGASLVTDVAADLPVLQQNSGLQLVPDVRVRGGVTWRF